MQNFWNIYPPHLPHPFLKPVTQHRGKYKRSTNNSHKKFICVARKLLLKSCSQGQRTAFQKEFDPHKNSRTYFFIILAHAKIRMSAQKAKQFTNAFATTMNRKIQIYHHEIQTTNNNNFIHFRFEEISDIQFAIRAMELYFQGQVEEAIETVYRKDRLTLFKRQQYDSAVKTILELQKRLRSYPMGSIFPYLSQQLQRQENPHNQQSKQPVELRKQIHKEGQQKSNESSDQQWQADIEESAQPKRYRSKNHNTKIGFNKYKSYNEMKPLEQRPLLCLQNSYPYFPHFFSILFKEDFENPQKSGQNLPQNWDNIYPSLFTPTNNMGGYINANLFQTHFGNGNQKIQQLNNSSILPCLVQKQIKIKPSGKMYIPSDNQKMQIVQKVQMHVKEKRQDSYEVEVE